MGRRSTSGLPVSQMTVIAMVAVVIVVAKAVLRMPIQVSGHAGVLWIAALLVGRAAVRRPGSAALMGLLGGTLVALLTPADAGMLFTIAKYVVPGIVIDVLSPLLGDHLERIPYAVAVGAAAHASKVAVDTVQSIVAGITGPLLVAGVTSALVLHIAFGALGGLLAALLLKSLIKAGVPQLAPLADAEGTS